MGDSRRSVEICASPGSELLHYEKGNSFDIVRNNKQDHDLLVSAA